MTEENVRTTVEDLEEQYFDQQIFDLQQTIATVYYPIMREINTGKLEDVPDFLLNTIKYVETISDRKFNKGSWLLPNGVHFEMILPEYQFEYTGKMTLETFEEEE